MRKFYHYFVLVSLLFLTACGQKGPLYLEEQPATAEQTAEISGSPSDNNPKATGKAAP